MLNLTQIFNISNPGGSGPNEVPLSPDVTALFRAAISVYSKGEVDALLENYSETTVIDNLLSTSATSALSAKQGKILKDSLNALTALITSDDTTLDTLQEVVEYIKLNREDLEALNINAIAGLNEALAAKMSVADGDARYLNPRSLGSDLPQNSVVRLETTGTLHSRLLFTQNDIGTPFTVEIRYTNSSVPAAQPVKLTGRNLLFDYRSLTPLAKTANDLIADYNAALGGGVQLPTDITRLPVLVVERGNGSNGTAVVEVMAPTALPVLSEGTVPNHLYERVIVNKLGGKWLFHCINVANGIYRWDALTSGVFRDYVNNVWKYRTYLNDADGNNYADDIELD